MKLSKYYKELTASPLRGARQIASNRKDKVKVIDTSIGSVSLATNPGIEKRMKNLIKGFKDRALPYTPTSGTSEAKKAFVRIYQALGIDISNLNIQITASGSMAMQYVMLGVLEKNKPLASFGPVYANYLSYGKRFDLPVVSISRILKDDGVFSMPSEKEIEKFIKKHQPSALLVVPADNPSGAFFSQESLEFLAGLCVKYKMWMISDEAYAGLYYTDQRKPSSIWRITNNQVKGIEGRRIGIHSASKNMSACGLRIGALITDNDKLAEKAVYCASADLCAGIVDQYLFAGIEEESLLNIQKYLCLLREHYFKMMKGFRDKVINLNSDLIVSKPVASIYQVVEFKKAVPKNFKALDFISRTAEKGRVMVNNQPYIMIGAPMSGFYQVEKGEKNPGDTQMRVAFVRNKKEMLLGAEVLVKQLKDYLG